MPDETGIATASSDAPSADDSPFADVAENTAAAVTGEQDSNEGAAQEPQGPDDGEEQAAPEELKVVVSIKGGRATIGVQQPKSDPHIESFDDHDLSGLAQEVPAVTERAKARWEDEPRYPVHVKPTPPARRQARRGQGAAQASTPNEQEAQRQPEMPRLL